MKKLILMAIFALTTHANADVIGKDENGNLKRNLDEIYKVVDGLIADCNKKTNWVNSLACSAGLQKGFKEEQIKAMENLVKANSDTIKIYDDLRKKGARLTSQHRNYIQSLESKNAAIADKINDELKPEVNELKDLIEKSDKDSNVLKEQEGRLALKQNPLLARTSQAARAVSTNKNAIRYSFVDIVNNIISTKNQEKANEALKN